MKLPSKSQALYAQIKMLEGTMRYIKDSMEEADFDLGMFAEVSLVCMHMKSILTKIEYTKEPV